MVAAALCLGEPDEGAGHPLPSLSPPSADDLALDAVFAPVGYSVERQWKQKVELRKLGGGHAGRGSRVVGLTYCDGD